MNLHRSITVKYTKGMNAAVYKIVSAKNAVEVEIEHDRPINLSPGRALTNVEIQRLIGAGVEVVIR